MQRLSHREASAIIFYRTRMKMSISHIAKLTERSTRTVWKLISKNCYVHKRYDKRHWNPWSRRHGESWFRRVYAKMKGWFYRWVAGYQGDISVLAEGEPP